MRMKLKPEERPKFIALMTAIMLVTCYLIFFIAPRLSSATPAPGAQETPAPQASALPIATPAAAPQNASITPDANRAALDLIDTEAPHDVKRDPFVAPATAPASTTPSPSTPTTAPPVQTPSPARPAVPTATQVPPTSAVLPSAVQPVKAFSLIGIASAEDAVAIFQIDRDVVEKRPGDTLPGNMRLEAIEEEVVRLSHGKQHFRMEIGQTPVVIAPGAHGEK